MKKILSMFAFVAAIVLGAFTLASCGGNDDDITPEATYMFKPVITFNTENEATKQNPEYMLLSTFERIFANVEGRKTDAEALRIWDGMLKLFNETVAPAMQLAVYKTNDYTITCTISLLKDGKEFKSQTFVATKPEK